MKNRVQKRCEICSAELKLHYKLKYNIYQCVSCGLLIADDVKFDLREGSILNEESRIVALKELRKKNFSLIINQLIAYFRDRIDLTGLEVGSSYGWFLEKCRENGISCIGIEPEERFWPIHEKNELKLIKGMFPQNCNSFKEKFDFIAFNDSFEHIPNLRENLNVCHNLLKKDGILILNLPLSTGFFYKIAKLLSTVGINQIMSRCWQFEFHSPHVYYFNKTSILKICDLFPFEIINYFQLEAIDYSTISHRINMDPNNSLLSLPATVLIYCLKPILRFVNEDLGTFFIKKA